MNENKKSILENADDHDERRWAKRNSASITARICLEDGNTSECVISSISMSGMYLVTGVNHYNESQHLVIDFPIEDDGLLKHFHETVHIIHVDNEGIAVAFDKYDSAHFITLQRLFHMIYRSSTTLKTKLQGDSPLAIHVDAVSH
jgi:hypothetical protein